MTVSSFIPHPSSLAGLLAISDGLQIFLFAAGIMANGIQAAILWRVMQNQKHLDARTEKIERLEGQKEVSTARLVQAEIDRKTGELNASIRELVGEIKRINQRLDDGDDQFDTIGEKGQATRILLANQTADLQKWMLETFASKRDVELVASRLDGMADHMRGVELEAARAAMAGKKSS